MAYWVTGSIKPFDDTLALPTKATITQDPLASVTVFEKYRQGVELRETKQIFESTQPKLWAGSFDEFGQVKHDQEYSSLGQAVDFTQFYASHLLTDQDVFDPEKFISLGINYQYPIYFNGGPQQQQEAIIEPLTVSPDRLPSLEGNNPIHSVHASVDDDNVKAVYHYDPTELSIQPWLDQGEDRLGDSFAGSITIPGYTSPVIPIINPFFDSSEQESKIDILQGDTSFKQALLAMSPEYVNALLGIKQKSATCGFYYNDPMTTRYGTDSLAFGGWQRDSSGKTSRSKGSIPKIQLLYSDNTIIRNNPINKVNIVGQQFIPFNDTKMVDFTSGFINLPSTLASGSNYLSSETTTTLYVSGTTIKSNVDSLVKIPYLKSSSFKPYTDHFNPESDAKAPSGSINTFYSIGSDIGDVGDGFSQPLWSKTKITIDLTPTQQNVFGISNYLSKSLNGPMAYWNHVSGVFQRIGNGTEFGNYIGTDIGTMQRFLREQTIGFGSSIGVATLQMTSASYAVGNPISIFGFPNASKFEASSDYCFPMDRYISEPFLLEKIVLVFSGALNLNKYYLSASSDICVTTFFVLNQRKAFIKQLDQTLVYFSGSSGSHSAIDSISLTTSSYGLTTTRDLVTWLQISRTPSSPYPSFNEGFNREFNYDSLDPTTGLEFSGQFIVSGSAKSPLSYEQANMEYLHVCEIENTSCEVKEAWEIAGRNLLEDRGRSWKNPVQSAEPFGQALVYGYWGAGYLTFNANKSYHSRNPYILLPTDNLIFGWSVPRDITANTINGSTVYEGVGPTLTISNKGVHKVILYGSLLRDGKEYHEVFEQSIPQDVLSEDLE